MHSEWVASGLDPERFWKLTPREIARETLSHIRLLEREHDERAWLAWHIAALPRERKFPRLKQLMSQRKKPKKPQSPDIQLAQMRAMFLAFGGDPKELENIK